MHKKASPIKFGPPYRNVFGTEALPEAIGMLIPCFQGESDEEIPAFLKESPVGLADKLMDAEALGKMDLIPYTEENCGTATCHDPVEERRFRRLLSGFLACVRSCNSAGTDETSIQCCCGAMTVFPNFRRNFPEGLFIGCGERRYAIRPSSVIIKKFRGENGEAKEISFSFQIKYSTGLQGIARYIDRFRDGDRVEQFRAYSDRSVVTSSFYRDHQKTHDLYRTLMGQVIQGEVSLTYYRWPAKAPILSQYAAV